MKDSTTFVNNERRKFFDLVGKAGVAAGILRASPLVAGIFANRYAQAAGTMSKRVIFVYTPDGAPGGMWLPSGSGSSMTLNAATKAYESVKTYCAFRSATMARGGGHGNTHQVLGTGSYDQDWKGDTLDVQIGTLYGQTSPFANVALGVQSNVGNQGLIGRKSGQAFPSEDSPAAAYKRFFSGATGGSTGGSDPNAQVKSVLELNQQALSSLKTKLGSLEKERLDAHSAALSRISSRLSTTEQPSGACGSVNYNPNGYPTDGGTANAFRGQAELQAEILVQAMACGLTKVATLQLANHQATWVGHNTTFKNDHHQACHAAGKTEQAEMVNYLSGCIAFLIQRLAATADPVNGGKMIDHTLVVQVSDMGDGADHSAGNAPNMIAGGSGFTTFKRGTAGTAENNEAMLGAVPVLLGIEASVGAGITKFASVASVV
ncbi:MAG TPA: DUF1552 domain-containing protein [Cellvibrionaceae bacterium]|nr:DUF1552 domain-containing protein [Cellvibrionaceae bacterium]HNG59774.1 DUF1552 domain-containing protein [Cellvibrionaceae bacterium]